VDRATLLRQYITKQQAGIEIGPWFNPIAPKRDGFNCLSMDVFDTRTLRERAAADPHITAPLTDIEDVDLVGSSTELEQVVRDKYPLGSFDYVISSHNFEHLPNPVRFLQACSRVLKSGGVISMAIPDHRMCFDHFRPLTTLTDWLLAYLDKRERPTPAQIFHQFAYIADYVEGGERRASFPSAWSPDNVVGQAKLKQTYADFLTWTESLGEGYLDVHCSVMTPSSFEMLVADCIHLDLLPLDIIEITAFEHEFHAHLRVVAEPVAHDEEAHRRRRDTLLRRSRDEEAVMSDRFRALRAERDTLLDTVERLAAAVHALEADVGALRDSRSWRLTTPLRWLSSTMRRTRAG
jgi:SAM-dependent methyltransferase